MVEKTLAFRQRRAADIRGGRYLRRVRQLLSRGWGHVAEIDSVLHKGLKTFFDRRNLATGLPWVRVLEQAIGAPRAVIVLIGPRGLGNTQQYKRDLAFVRQTRDPAFRPWSSTLGRATRSGICANTQLACLFGEHRIQ